MAFWRAIFLCSYLRTQQAFDDAVVAAINREVGNITVFRDSETGLLSYTGEARTGIERALVAAINDTNIRVNLSIQGNTYESQDGLFQPLIVGAYDGSFYADWTLSLETRQYFDPEAAEAFANVGGTSVGFSALHEIIESHVGALLNPATPYSTSRFNRAHAQTLGILPDPPGLPQWILRNDGDYISVVIPGARGTITRWPMDVARRLNRPVGN